MAREARLYYSTLNGVNAVALVGLAPIARVIDNLFVELNKQTQVSLRMFGSEDEALTWLTRWAS